MKSLISVIIPTYKRDVSIVNRSVKSALDQTYKNIEVLIIDDSPADFTKRQTIKAFFENHEDSRVRYIQHEQNLGANAARNTGITQAKGVYYAFLDDDDIWLTTKLEKQIQRFEDQKVGLVYCKSARYNESANEFSIDDTDSFEGYVFDELMYVNFIGSNSFVMISKDCVEDVGPFAKTLLSSQDWELFLRISKKYKIACCNEILALYFVHEGERITKNPEKQLQGWKFIINEHSEYLNEHTSVYNYWKYRMIPNYIKNKQYLEGTSLLVKLLIFSPVQTVNNLTSTLFKKKQSKKIEYSNVSEEWIKKVRENFE